MLPVTVAHHVKILTFSFLIYERNERRINTFGDVCWFFRSFRQFVDLLESLIYLKACTKIVEIS
jgi:hypothetical protein